MQRIQRERAMIRRLLASSCINCDMCWRLRLSGAAPGWWWVPTVDFFSPAIVDAVRGDNRLELLLTVRPSQWAKIAATEENKRFVLPLLAMPR